MFVLRKNKKIGGKEDENKEGNKRKTRGNRVWNRGIPRIRLQIFLNKNLSY